MKLRGLIVCSLRGRHRVEKRYGQWRQATRYCEGKGVPIPCEDCGRPSGDSDVTSEHDMDEAMDAANRAMYRALTN